MPRRVSSLSQQVSAFVDAAGGARPIYSVLVANNGIAAVKFIRSVRKWAFSTFGSEKAITLVAMATHDDIKSNAEHIHIADQLVEVPSGASANNYGNVGLITQTAVQAAVDAVWPGWGHASEVPDLPRALAAAGIVFLGPRADAMAALGDKVASSILAQSAGVPTLPWSGSGVTLDLSGDAAGGVPRIPDAVYKAACVDSEAAAVESCNEIGYPIMIKASWGGGGKGIRKVHCDDDVRLVFKQVLGEVPGSPVFAMKLAPQSRHLEVQLLCDAHGGVVSVFTRDCSVQRRHQKIVEEGPATAAPAAALAEMEACARRLAASVGYVGAATVEFLYVIEEARFYFLELNPRLQVEHPVTEWIAGVNIPAAQVMIGMGVPLAAMPDVRALFLRNGHGGPVDFETAPRRAPDGHVVAVRITSEHAEDGFKPTCGHIDELHFRSTPEVWGYFSVKPGGRVHEFSDSQFGHVFAKGADRAAALKAMVVALKEIKIRGEIRTLVDYVIDMLQEPEFVGNQIHTGWLDGRIAAQVRVERPPWHLSVIAGAMHFAFQELSANAAEYLSYLQKGQAAPAALSLTASTVVLSLDAHRYIVHAARTAPDAFELTLNATTAEVVARKLPDGSVLTQVDGAAHVIHAEEEVSGTRLIIDNLTVLLPNEHDPSRLQAHSPGKLVRYLVGEGEHVEQDQPYAEMEAMKQIMLLAAPAAGRVRLHAAEAAPLAAGDLVATLELDAPAAVAQRQPFAGAWPELSQPRVESDSLHQAFTEATHAAEMLLAGYARSPARVLDDLLDVLRNEELPYAVWDDQWAAIARTVPEALSAQLRGAVARARAAAAAFPGREVAAAIRAALDAAPITDQRAIEAATAHALELAQQMDGGQGGYARCLVRRLLQHFLESEAPFRHVHDASSEADAVEALRKAHPSSMQHVLDSLMSHRALPAKARFVAALLSAVVALHPDAFQHELKALAAMPATAPLLALVQRAQQLLEASLLGRLSREIAAALVPPRGGHSRGASVDTTSGSEMGVASCDAEDTAAQRPATQPGQHADLKRTVSQLAEDLSDRVTLEDKLALLVGAPAPVAEAAALLLGSPDPALRHTAVLLYIRRLYATLLIDGPEQAPPDAARYQWRFRAPTEAGGQEPRCGHLIFADAPDSLAAQLEGLQPPPACAAPSNLHVIMPAATLLHDDSRAGGTTHPGQDSGADNGLATERALGDISVRLTEVVRHLHRTLRHAGVGCVTFLCLHHHSSVLRRGYEWAPSQDTFAPAHVLSFLEAPTAAMLEAASLPEAATYVPSHAHQLHSFITEERASTSNLTLKRAWVRSVVRRLEGADGDGVHDVQAAVSAAQAQLSASIRELSRLSTQSGGAIDWASVSVSVLPPVRLGGGSQGALVGLRRAVAAAVTQQAGELRARGVAEWTVRLQGPPETGCAWRAHVAMASGHEFGEGAVHICREHASDDEAAVSRDLHAASGQPERTSRGAEPLTPLQQRRLHARRHKTTYCYDFPAVFDNALHTLWSDYVARGGSPPPGGGELVRADELVLADGGGSFRERGAALRAVARCAGSNDVGIVAWRLALRTPEWPEGRDVVVVANDITFRAGAFGPNEHAVFRAVCDHAVAEGLPLLYLAANSGARVGLDQRLKECVQVRWTNEAAPEQGWQYLYLSDADYETYAAQCGAGSLPFAAAEVPASGDTPRHWRLTDIIGSEDGLGVECLSGSGAIAAAFARAFDEGFTATLVSGRTVGIGAYLARLGRRVVQREDQPIILTGYQALNKLLGRPVYSSQLQIGGPRVMAANGVSQLTIPDDLTGVRALLQWLAFAPRTLGGAMSCLRGARDAAARIVAYAPPPARRFDVRAAIEGDSASGGLFDAASWIEYHGGWARTVVTGRARLTGLPVGIVGVETETVQLSMPADPGMPDSSEQQLAQAGQVWYPDSAAKTAQAIEEFDREGLPLVVLANFRGFSGGQRDLFEGVLQAGSCIVNSLRTFRGPVLVYLPPGCELRGGAWVVLDSQINAASIDMFADPTAQGGVLEAEGIVEIKYRKAELRSLMHRLDDTLRCLDAQRGGTSGGAQVEAAIRAREEQLLPVYHGVALRFAEMHDTPVRMLRKGVIEAIVPWRQARTVLATRLRSRLAEQSSLRQIAAADPTLRACEAQRLLDQWRQQDHPDNGASAHDARANANGAARASSALPAAALDGGSTRGANGDDGAMQASQRELPGATARVVARDAAFVRWCESEEGAARISRGVDAVARGAVEAQVLAAARTAAGREGLWAGLRALAGRDEAFRSQLAALLP